VCARRVRAAPISGLAVAGIWRQNFSKLTRAHRLQRAKLDARRTPHCSGSFLSRRHRRTVD
jgi:hypothetical protein